MKTSKWFRYSPLLKSSKSKPYDFEITYKTGNITLVDLKYFLFRRVFLNENEHKILHLFHDEIVVFMNPVRNEIDFQGKIKRLLRICRAGLNDERSLSEAHVLIDEICKLIEETIKPID